MLAFELLCAFCFCFNTKPSVICVCRSEQSGMLDYICWFLLFILGFAALALGVSVMSISMSNQELQADEL